MYLYDEIDQRLVDERVAQFRDQTRRFLAGKLSEDEFRAAAAAERPLHPALCADAAHRHPLRAAVLAPAAQARARSRASTTAATATSRTRQNLQLNWPQARGRARHPRRARHGADARHPDLAATASATSPPTTSPASRRTRSSTPFVWCELIRQWSTFHPEFTYLPRKFKIAVNGARARPRGVARARHRPARRARMRTAKSASRCSSAAASAARR